tara:strand:- start:9678 stop:10391 length:714 start_codon:yes stop_codon:yes gene_type:complete
MNMNVSKGNYAIPASIVIAGAFIALAIFFTAGKNAVQPAPSQPLAVDTTDRINPVTAEDHIRGSIDAQVFVVEYSDFECPFCKRFHPTMKQVMEAYDADEVAWVYRQFPLDSLHPVKARREAITSECVAELGGNDAFWQFTDRFFEVTPSNNQTDLDVVLPEIIAEIGLSQEAVDECVASGRYDQHVQDDVDNAFATGGQGTPWSVIIGKNGETFPLSGAQPYTSVTQLIDIALKDK